MHKRTRFHALSVIPCLALSLLAQAPAPDSSAKAPAEGSQPIKIAPHESRWDYPKEVTLPPDTQLHIVEKGDPLWDLSSKYLGNPFAWPQIWELNKWVTDPHWIFPGDGLIVDGSRKAVAPVDGSTAPDEVADLQPDVKHTPPRRARDEYSYTFQDFIQIPFLAERGTKAYLKKVGALNIVAKQDTGKDLQGDGDLVYLDGGTDQGFKVGDRLLTLEVQATEFFHPDDVHHRRALGDILQQSGILRITQAYPRESVALIEKSMDTILVGQYATTYSEPPTLIANLRTDVAEPVSVKPGGPKIIYIRDGKTMAGQGEMVIIDQGANAGLRVGDDLLVARPHQLDPTRKATAKDSVNSFVGQIVVVRVDDRSATCRILRSKVEVQVGDLLTQ